MNRACNRLVYGRGCGRSSVQPTDRSLTSDPPYQASPLRTFAARHRSCTADCSIPVFRYRFEPSRPGPVEVLPSCRRATLLGFTSALRRLAPASGERSFLIARAHLPVRPTHSPRLIFVGLIRPRIRQCVSGRMSRESADDRIGFWASTPVCGPCLAAIVSSPRDRSCLGLCLLQGCGHFLTCIRAGSTPPGSSNPKGRDPISFT
jgi:hypothetical protein